MYETEANTKIASPDEIPADIAARFGELKGTVLERTVLPWSEHCTECVWPTCYSTCDLYSPREDGRCRRFVDGMVRVDCPEALNRYILKISFKRWGKLWTPGNIRLHSVAGALKRERSDYKAGKLIQRVPLPLSIKSFATEKRYSFKKRMAYRQQFGQTVPTSLLVECYNPGTKAAHLSLTIRPADPRMKVAYQQLIELSPGFNRVRVPYKEMETFVDLHSAFNVELTPNSDEDGTTLYFGLLDFIHEDLALDRVNEEDRDKGKSKKVKCVVWDLDNTIWDGILVEDGMERIRLKPEIKEIIETLDQRGILHSIASKNNYDEAMAVLRSFQIDEYFLHPQISWQPKSQAIQTIARQLNIGVDSLLFVDDSEFELQQVKSVHSDVRVMDSRQYLELPAMEPCLVPVTSESRERRRMYRMEVQRQDIAQKFADDYQAFLIHCQIRLSIRPMQEATLERVHELTQRTNQMNFSGNRYDREVLRTILSTPHVDTFVLEVEDRFGTYGIVGFSIVDSRIPLMTDLMFSCRIQAKRVEHAFLSYLLRKYIAQTGKDFWVNYRETPRNAPSGQVFADMGMEKSDTKDGVSRLLFRRDWAIPNDGVIKIMVQDPVSSC